MIILLAPSKTMDFASVPPTALKSTHPYFLPQAESIVDRMRGIPDIKEVMSVSDGIAQTTRASYAQWGGVTQPAIYAYVGDVYKGFFARTLSREDLEWAQRHLRILSGLYGALRPLDYVSAYRLEMRAKLAVADAKDLYDFWGRDVAAFVDADAEGIVCVLSSEEYAKVVTADTSCRIITPVFLDKKQNGKIGTVPIYSKMMRGVMARWMIDNRVTTPDQLKDFSLYGYSYDKAHSTDDGPAFYREVMTPLRFNV